MVFQSQLSYHKLDRSSAEIIVLVKFNLIIYTYIGPEIGYKWNGIIINIISVIYLVGG